MDKREGSVFNYAHPRDLIVLFSLGQKYYKVTWLRVKFLSVRVRNLPLLRHNGCNAVLRYALWFYFAAQSFLRELAQNSVIHCDVIMALNIGSTIVQSTRLNDFAKFLIQKMLLNELILFYLGV